MDPLRIGVAIFLVCAVVVGVLWLRARDAKASTRRREAMMKRIDFNPKLLSLHDPLTRTVGGQVRRQCAKCTHEDYCERWLAGAIKGSNGFCPNAKMFEKLSKVRPRTNDDEKAA